MKKLTTFIFLSCAYSGLCQTLNCGPVTPQIEMKNPVITPLPLKGLKNFFVSNWEADKTLENHIYSWNENFSPFDEDIALPGSKKEKSSFRDIICTKEKLVLLRSVPNKNEGNTVLYAHEINARLEVQEVGTEMTRLESGKQAEFGINTSPNKEFVVVFGEYPKEKGSDEKYSISVFDKTLKKKWQKEYTFPIRSVKNPFNDVFISDKGKVFIIKRTDQENFSCFTISSENGNAVESKLNPGEGKKIMNYNCGFNKEGDLVICGFYSEDKEFTVKEINFHGNFYFRMSGGNGKIISQKTNSYAKPLLNCEPQYIFCTDDNTCLLIGEYFRKEYQGTGSGFVGEEQTFYYVNSLYVSMLDENGKSQWETEIKKTSESLNDGAIFSRAGFFESGEKFYFVLNDETRNYSLNDGKVPVLIAINKDGTREKPVIMLNSKVGGKGDVNLIPGAFIKFSDKEYLFLGQGEEGIYPVTLKLK